MGERGDGRVLVAGGAGFLGSHLCERLLAQGRRVVCLDNFVTGARQNLRSVADHPQFELVQADVTEPPPDLARGGIEQIYNLACIASPALYQAEPEQTLLTSVVGAQRLLRLAEACGARYLQASSSEVYGDPHVHPQAESYWGHVNCTGPRACYDEGKRAAESLVFDYDRTGRAEVRVARIFNTYGPRLTAGDGRVVANVVSQALAGEDITIYGDGSQTRSFCYVDDMIDALIRLMELEGPQPGPVNLGNPVEISVRQLVELVLRLTGSSSRVTHQRLPTDDPKRRRPDITRAGELLGWTPATSIEQGLNATIAWFESALARAEAMGEPLLTAQA